MDRQEGVEMGAGVMSKLSAGKCDAIHFVKTIREEGNPGSLPASHD
jgi:hypothetical protein